MSVKRRPARPNKRQQASRGNPESRRISAPLVPNEPVARVVYGKAFIVAEDSDKNTFSFDGAAWVPYSNSIAECRLTCLVKELPQRLKNMTRYEVRQPV
jgi:hypothetical protein